MDVTSMLGQRMIMGWTLLDVVCGVCKVVPLIEDKRKNFTECVQCHRSFKRENGELVEIKKVVDNVPTTNNTAAVVPTKQESFRDIDREEYNELRNNRLNSNNNNNNSISTLNQLISSSSSSKQQQSIIKTNVIKEKDHGVEKEEEDEDYDYDDEDYEPFSESERLQFEQRMKKTEEISTKIGQKLMLGWALLGDVCPNDPCLDTPLMRDREKYYICVSCGARALDIKDLKQSSSSSSSTPTPMAIEQSTQQQQQQQQQQQIPSNGISPIKEPILKRQKQEQESSQPTQIFSKPIVNYSSSSSSSPSSNNTKCLLHEEIKDMPFVVDKTLETLLTKLKEYESKIGTASSIPQGETLQQFSIIRECAQAITSLVELKKQLL